jgi:hypothetical protein
MIIIILLLPLGHISFSRVDVFDDVLQWSFAHDCDLMIIEVVPYLTRS